MPRVHHVQKSRKVGRCSKCGKEIPTGSHYRYFKQRYGPLTKVCDACQIKQSDLSSAKYAVLYDAIEDARKEIEDAESVDDLRCALETVGESAREIAEEYEASGDAIEEHFQGGDTLDQIREYQEACEALADACESWDPPGDAPEDLDRDDYDSDEEFEEAQETALSDARSDAESALDDFSL